MAREKRKEMGGKGDGGGNKEGGNNAGEDRPKAGPEDPAGNKPSARDNEEGWLSGM